MSRNSKQPSAPNVGQITEQYANRYLQQQGLVFIAKNIRYKFGEIDLLMREQSKIIFVEVKYRNRIDYGGAISAISYAQRHRLQKAASAWLQKHDPSQRLICRFDMIALSGDLDNLHCDWLKNIFQ